MSYRLEAPWLRLFCPIPDVFSEYEHRIGPYRGVHARLGTYVCTCMRLILAMSPAASCEHTRIITHAPHGMRCDRSQHASTQFL